MNAEQTKQLRNLQDACVIFYKNKFALINKSISILLTEIVKNKLIYNIIVESTLNYNFDREFKKATSAKGNFLMPENEYEICAFTVNLLDGIDDNKIKIVELLKNHFDNDAKIAFGKFYTTVIESFFVSVKNILQYDYESLSYNEEAKNQSQQEIIKDNFVPGCRNLIEVIALDRWLKIDTKDEAVAILNSMIECFIEQTTKPLFGLFLGLKNTLPDNKKFKNELLVLENEIKKLKK